MIGAHIRPPLSALRRAGRNRMKLDTMETRQQHKYDIWASNLLFLGFGLSLLMGFLRHTGYFASDLQTKDYITLYLITPLLLVMYYYIRKGVRAVKILFLTLYGVTLVQFLPSNSGSIPTDATLKTFDFFSQHILQLGAGVLILLSLWGPQLSRTKQAPHAQAEPNRPD